MATSPSISQRTMALGSAVIGSYTATTSTYNSYVQLSASTDAVYIVGVRLYYSYSGSASTTGLRIATGAAASEVVVFQVGALDQNGPVTFTLPYPLKVASGTRLSLYVGGNAFTYTVTVIYAKESAVS